MNPKGRVLIGLLLGWINWFPAMAATDALSLEDFRVGGFLSGRGGVAWGFMPKTNLLVTEVGYFNGGLPPPDPEVSFWAGTNGPVATYQEFPVALGLEFTNVAPLILWAGQEYRLSLQFGSVASNSNFQISLFTQDGSDSTPLFKPAPELTYLNNYSGFDGVFTVFGSSNVLCLGPTFRFVTMPSLEIVQGGGATVLLWPTNTGNFVAETATVFESGSWQQIVGSPMLSGDRYALTNRWSDQIRFFRLRLR